MFATIDSLRSEESLRPAEPHSRDMVSGLTETQSGFTFSPPSPRPAPPRCSRRMTSAPLEEWQWSGRLRNGWAVAVAGPAGDWAATTSWCPGLPPRPPVSSSRHLGSWCRCQTGGRREGERPRRPQVPPSTPLGAPPQHPQPATFHFSPFDQYLWPYFQATYPSK